MSDTNAAVAEAPVVTEVQTQEAPVGKQTLGSILEAALNPKDAAALDAMKANLPEKPVEQPPAKEKPEPKQPDAKDKATKPAAEKPMEELEKAGVADDPDLPKLPIDELNEAAEEVEPDVPADKVGAAMKRLREEKRDLSQTLETEKAERTKLEARLAELEAKANQIEEYEKRISDYETEMSVVKIEKTRAFDEKVRQPLVKISESLSAIAEKYELDYDQLADAMEIEDSDKAEAKINELVSGMNLPVTDIVKLINLRGQTQPVLKARADMFANADKNLLELKALEEGRTEEQILERARERERLFPKVADRVTKLTPFFEEQFNAVREDVSTIDPDSIDTSEKVYNALVGRAFPKIAKAYAAIAKERDELLDELAGYKEAKPTGGQFVQQGGQEAPKSLADALMRARGQ